MSTSCILNKGDHVMMMNIIPAKIIFTLIQPETGLSPSMFNESKNIKGPCGCGLVWVWPGDGVARCGCGLVWVCPSRLRHQTANVSSFISTIPGLSSWVSPNKSKI